MDESTLIRLSVLCSVVGLIALFYFSATVTSNVVKINSITPDDIGILVRVEGNITYMYVSKTGHIFLDIGDDSGEIDVVIFNTTAPNVGIDPYKLGVNDCIGVVGRVELYESKLEIIPKTMERC